MRALEHHTRTEGRNSRPPLQQADGVVDGPPFVDSGRWRSGFRNDVDQDYEVMPITIPTRCRSQIATASEW